MRKLLLLLLFFGIVAYAVDISACTALSANTVYRLTASITNADGTCMNVTGNNVTLNLNSFTIDGTNNGVRAAINATASSVINLTIENGTIQEFGMAFRESASPVNWTIQNVSFINISNATSATLFSALTASRFNNLTIRNSTIWQFGSTSSNINFTNSIITRCPGTCIEVIGGSDNFRVDNVTIINVTTIGLDFSDTSTDGVRVQNVNITNASFPIRFNNLGSDGGTVDHVLIFNSSSGFRNDFASQMNVSNSSVFNTTAYINNGEMNMSNVTFGLNSTVNINWNGSFQKTTSGDVSEGSDIIAAGINFASVDSSGSPFLDTQAVINIQTDAGCINITIWEDSGLPVSRAEIMADGAPHFRRAICSSGISTFNVSDFSGFALGPDPIPVATLVSPLNSNVSGVSKTFSWVCNNSMDTSLTGTLFINGSSIISIACTNNSACNYSHSAINACANISWLVGCADTGTPQGNNSTASTFNQIPVPQINSPANGTQFYNIQQVLVQGNATCVGNQSVVTVGTVNHTATCSAQNCNATNSTRGTGAYNITIWYQSYLGIWFNSSSITIFSNSSIPGTSNVSFNTTFTYNEFIAHTNGFYQDYGPHILAILSYAFAFLLTRRYPATLIAGGIGFVTVFFLFGAANFGFLAAGILSIVIGYGYKQVVG